MDPVSPAPFFRHAKFLCLSDIEGEQLKVYKIRLSNLHSHPPPKCIFQRLDEDFFN